MQTATWIGPKILWPVRTGITALAQVPIEDRVSSGPGAPDLPPGPSGGGGGGGGLPSSQQRCPQTPPWLWLLAALGVVETVAWLVARK